MKVVLTQKEFEMIKAIKKSGTRCDFNCPFYGEDDCNKCPLWQFPESIYCDDGYIIDFLADNGVVEE